MYRFCFIFTAYSLHSCAYVHIDKRRKCFENVRAKMCGRIFKYLMLMYTKRGKLVFGSNSSELHFPVWDDLMSQATLIKSHTSLFMYGLKHVHKHLLASYWWSQPFGVEPQITADGCVRRQHVMKASRANNFIDKMKFSRKNRKQFVNNHKKPIQRTQNSSKKTLFLYFLRLIM